MSLPCCKCKCGCHDEEYCKIDHLPQFRRGQTLWITAGAKPKGPYNVTSIVYDVKYDQFLYYLSGHTLRYGEQVLTSEDPCRDDAGEVFVCGEHQEAYYIK